MPIYEYECAACGEREEHTQRIADAPLTTCARCGKEALHRVISPSAFHLKGGGWYKDGYGSSQGQGKGGGGGKGGSGKD